MAPDREGGLAIDGAVSASALGVSAGNLTAGRG